MRNIRSIPRVGGVPRLRRSQCLRSGESPRRVGGVGFRKASDVSHRRRVCWTAVREARERRLGRRCPGRASQVAEECGRVASRDSSGLGFGVDRRRCSGHFAEFFHPGIILFCLERGRSTSYTCR